MFTDADLAYIAGAFSSLDELCVGRREDPTWIKAQIAAGLLPRPAYTLPDGQAVYPRDYFVLLDDAGSAERMATEFDTRFRASAERAGLDFTEDWNPQTEWIDYLDGTYWACLWEATPEAMIEKERLIRSIRDLDERPDPASEQWRARLAAAVDALDRLERPFTDYDRARWDWTSRGLYITAIRERYPELRGGTRVPPRTPSSA